MIYSCPTLEPVDKEVVELIQQQRVMLNFRVNQNPNRWSGFLRRNTFARALQGSNSIEGYNATLAEAVAIVDEERPESLEEETIKALQGYRIAMTYILRVHNDPFTQIDAGFIRSLHFMMLNYDLTKLPGQWRPGHIFLVQEPSGERVYEGPDAESVPELMGELLYQIAAKEPEDATIRAAMAHLNLTMIHPFKDGNGRMARALQTLVLAREGITGPVFSSIEEWLGRNTLAYYNILADVGQGNWHPERSALPWVRFCLRAHYQQAATIIKRNAEIGYTWQEISQAIAKHRLPERCELALMDAAFGYKVRNLRYREDNSISDVVASRDFKLLCDLGLFMPVGEKRGRYYTAAKPLMDIRERCRDRTKASDPYEVVRMKAAERQALDQQDLPGLR
jgi:Fic family protein